MKPNINCLQSLTPAQLQQLRTWIETLGYRKAVERATKEFSRPIHKTALQRFVCRAAPAEFLEDNPEHDEATRQILKFAADGRPDFTLSTVRVLEQLAFQLALSCTRVDDDMNALAKITTMLCRFRNASVRERMAAVQEGKLRLRQQELEQPAPAADDGAWAVELSRKINQVFELHPALTAIREAEEKAAAENSRNSSTRETPLPFDQSRDHEGASIAPSHPNQPSPHDHTQSPHPADPAPENMPEPSPARSLDTESTPVPPKNKNSINRRPRTAAPCPESPSTASFLEPEPISSLAENEFQTSHP